MVTLYLILAVWGGGYSTSATWGEGYCDMPASSLSTTDYNFKVLDRWPYGSGFSVLLDSNILYYTNGAVLQIGRLNAQGKVSWLSELIFPGLAYTLARWENRLYVAVDDQGIAIIDISSPDAPKEIKLFPTGGRTFGLEVRGDTVYGALGNAGLEIYDCSDGSNPKLLGTLTGFNLRSLSLYEGRIFATDASIGLITIDVSNPSSPSLIKSLKLPGQHYGLALDTLSDKAWICSFDGGLHIVDISNPASPGLASTIPIFVAWAVDIVPPYAYVVTWNDSLHIIGLDTYDEISSTNLYNLDSAGIWAYDVSCSQGFGAVAGFSGSWWVFDNSDPSNPDIKDGQARGGLSDVVSVSERWIVLGMQGSKIAIFERGDPLSPKVTFSTKDWPRDAAIINDTLYIAESWSGLSLYDISDPLSGVELISRFNPEQVHVWGLALDSPYAYLACGDSGLIIAEVSDPKEIKRVSSIAFGVRAFTVSLYGETLYMGLEDASVAEVNVSNPAEPLVVARHTVSGVVTDIIREDSIIYLAEFDRGLGIYGLSGIQWTRLSLTPTRHVAFSMDLVGNTLFLAEGSEGISAFDISDPYLPHLVGRLNTGGEARALVVVLDTVILADGYDGLERALFLKLGSNESYPSKVPDIFAWPNPCSRILYFSTPVKAAIYDESGRYKDFVNGLSYDVVKLEPGTYFLVGTGWYRKFVKFNPQQ